MNSAEQSSSSCKVKCITKEKSVSFFLFSNHLQYISCNTRFVVFSLQRKSVTESHTSVMTLTWILRAVRAALVCLDTRPAALESKLTPANTASPQRWPPWRRKVSGKERSVSAQQPAVAARLPLGLTQEVKLKQKMRGGKKKV